MSLSPPRNNVKYSALSPPRSESVTLKGGFDFPPASRRWEVSERRKELRDTFNTNELCALQIMRKYDIDDSGALETNELETMLKDYSHPKSQARKHEGADIQEGIRYILCVADKNNDSKIQVDEVLFGLRAWYCFGLNDTHLKDTLSRMGYSGDRTGLPEFEELKKIMEECNDNMQVRESEVIYVRSILLKLGDLERGGATNLLLYQALSAWYLNVERLPTSGFELNYSQLNLLGHMAQETNGHFYHTYRRVVKLASALPVLPVALPRTDESSGSLAHMNAEGNPHSHDCALHPNCLVGVIGFPIFVGIATLVSLAVPLLLIHIARANPRKDTCDFDLNGVLQVSAFLCLASVVCNVCKDILSGFQAFVFTGQCFCELTGFVFTMLSSTETCGETLHLACQIWFFYKLLTLMAICLSCCIYFYSQAYNEAHEGFSQDDAALIDTGKNTERTLRRNSKELVS